MACFKTPEHREKDWKALLQTTINEICSSMDDTVFFYGMNYHPLYAEKYPEMPLALQVLQAAVLAVEQKAQGSALSPPFT